MLAIVWAFLGTGIGRIVGGALAAAVLMIGLQAFQAFSEWRVSRAYAKGVAVVVAAIEQRDATAAELEKRAARDAAVIEAMRYEIEEGSHARTDAGGGAAADWGAELDRVLDAARAPEN